MNVRFTTWLSEAENSALVKEASALNASRNYVVRMAVRAWLGLDGDDNQQPVSRLLRVTSDTAVRKEDAG